MPNLHGSTIVANPLKIVRAVKCKLQSAFVGNAQFPLDVQSAHEVPGPPLEHGVPLQSCFAFCSNGLENDGGRRALWAVIQADILCTQLATTTIKYQHSPTLSRRLPYRGCRICFLSSMLTLHLFIKLGRGGDEHGEKCENRSLLPSAPSSCNLPR